MSELIKRTLSGAAYVAVVIGVIVWAPDYVNTMITILAMMAAHEYFELRGQKKMSLSTFLGILATATLWTVLSHNSDTRNLVCLTFYSIVLIAALLLELWRKADDPIRNWGDILVAQVMIGLPFATMVKICEINNLLLLAVFVIIWTNDTFAYCTGSLLSKRPGGNHKMFERVSPKKSWEGLIGGIVFALVAGYIFSLFVTEYSWYQWLVLALTISVFGTLGDLMESLLKRTIGVKDSGKFLPGHGGVLDRFDSILLAAPVVYIVILWLV